MPRRTSRRLLVIRILTPGPTAMPSNAAATCAICPIRCATASRPWPSVRIRRFPSRPTPRPTSPASCSSTTCWRRQGSRRTRSRSAFQGVNDQVQLTATGFDCGLSTVRRGSSRGGAQPGPATDPNDIRAFIDIFTDISGLFVIKQRKRLVRGLDDSRPSRRADRCAGAGRPCSAPSRRRRRRAQGDGKPVTTNRGTCSRWTAATPISRAPAISSRAARPTSCRSAEHGRLNCLQQSDCHAYWEFNYTTNWIQPTYELLYRRHPGHFRGRQHRHPVVPRCRAPGRPA